MNCSASIISNAGDYVNVQYIIIKFISSVLLCMVSDSAARPSSNDLLTIYIHYKCM